MGIITLLEFNFFGIVSLLFILYLTLHSFLLNKKEIKYFSLAIITNIIIILIQIWDYLLEQNIGSEIFKLRRLVNFFGFSLPILIVLFLLLYFTDYKPMARRMLALPAAINMILCLLSCQYGIIFYIDENGVYSRGFGYYIPLVIGIIYLIILIYKISSSNYFVERDEIFFIIALSCVVICSIIFQISTNINFIIWNTAALGLVLYFNFIHSQYYKYDTLSKVLNRSKFDNDFERCIGRNFTIILFDIDNFKYVNDNFGHSSGDILIINTAKILMTNIVKYGRVYRIGGDEFLAICFDLSDHKLKSILDNINKSIEIYNKTSEFNLGISYGCSKYNKDGNKSIQEIFDEADKEMYISKRKKKEKQIDIDI